jgi:pimeloyl-ACP methyl ester carboxylesterase
MRTISLLLAGCLAAGAGVISIKEQGAGDPIVFLPGLGCRGEVWNRVAGALPDHRKVLVSIAGFGGVPGQSDAAAVRDAVAQLVRQKGWRNATLVGHSVGGSMAIAIAAANPDLFARLVILDAYPFPAALLKPGLTPEQAPAIAAAVRAMITSLSEAQYRDRQSQAFRTMITAEQDVKDVLASLFASDRATVARAQYETLSADLRPLLSKITGPILVLGSADSRARLEAQYLGAARVEVSDSARHFLMLDDPAWVARRIAEFAAR